ncbi:MAG: ABC transporter permease [Lachnospiraceae bacterium]|jgi:spermidine/putrescine transport system permease protein|nr:ABC transporter permease [Lachnospiraceae bacterium]
MVNFRRFLQKFYLGLVILFLYAPILVLIVLSFNSSKSRSKWGGFTTKWYSSMFANDTIMLALKDTLLIAVLSALLATLLGTAAAIAINHMRKVPRTIMLGITNIPMLNAEIVTGISLMLLFLAINLNLGFFTVLLSHIAFNVPYVILSVMPKLAQTNQSTYEAALDLGATPLRAFFLVVFPDIFPGVISGFLLAFTLSLDDFIITHFTRGATVNTLSTLIYSETRKGIKPEMYALSTLLFVGVLVLLILVNRLGKKSEDQRVRES